MIAKQNRPLGSDRGSSRGRWAGGVPQAGGVLRAVGVLRGGRHANPARCHPGQQGRLRRDALSRLLMGIFAARRILLADAGRRCRPLYFLAPNSPWPLIGCFLAQWLDSSNKKKKRTLNSLRIKLESISKAEDSFCSFQERRALLLPLLPLSPKVRLHRLNHPPKYPYAASQRKHRARDVSHLHRLRLLGTSMLHEG